MATTRQPSANALTVKKWHELLYRDTEKELYFEKFTGEDEDSIVQLIRDLEKGKGDQITFGLVPRLTGDFVDSDSGISMENNEQKLDSYSFPLLLKEYKLAVKWETGMDLQRPVWDIPDTARKRLITNDAEDIDKLHFKALLAAPTQVLAGNGVLCATAALADAQVTNAITHKITPSLIRRLKAIATTGAATVGAGDNAPVRVFNPIRPTKVKGQNYFIFLIPPYAAFDLGENSEYHQNLREVLEYTQNPIFQGGIALVDGVVLHCHENMPIFTNSNSIASGRGVFMGAQALLKAYGSYRAQSKLNGVTTQLISKSFGYDEAEGLCTKTITRVMKPNFNSRDYGSIGVSFAMSDLGA